MLRSTTLMIVGLAGAALFAQAPEFTQQYRQRLGGAAEELRSIVARFDADAARYGLSRSAAIQRYNASPDDFLQDRGVSMNEVLARYDAISLQEQQLQSENVILRPFLIARAPDRKVFDDTLSVYRPAVPTTPEGGVYGVIGFFIARTLWGFILSILGLSKKRRRA